MVYHVKQYVRKVSCVTGKASEWVALDMRHVFLDFGRTLFDTEAFYNYLELKYIKGTEAISDDTDFSNFLYPDVIRFIQNCQSENYLCYLVTFGERSIQEGKVKLSGIEKYFDQLFYVEQGSKAIIIENYLKTTTSSEKVIFIDDTVNHWKDFTRLIPDGIAIRICRLGAKGSDIVDSRLQTCSNLDDFFL